jgi:N-acetylmuramoyl-L-alanine amidase
MKQFQPTRITTKCLLILMLLTLIAGREIECEGQMRLFVLGKDAGWLPCKLIGDEVLVPCGEWLKEVAKGVEELKDGILRIKRYDGKCIELRPSSIEAVVDGRNVKLQHAPELEDEKLYLPIKSLCELLNLGFAHDGTTGVGYICAVLSSVDMKQSGGGWLLDVSVSSSVPYNIERLSAPERIYIDVHHCLIIPPKYGEVMGRHGSIARVRIGQYSSSPPIARVVVDTDGRLEWDDKTEKDESGKVSKIRILIHDLLASEVSKGKVNAVKLEKLDGRVRGLITAEGAFRWRTFTLSDPYRVVVDFRNCELMIQPGSYEIPKNDIVKEVRVGTPEVDGETVTRVVFELFKPVRYRVIEKRADGVVSVEFGVSRFANATIVIDPGHGGHDPGAMSPPSMFARRLIEKELTLDIATRLQRLLSSSGVNVVMTRSGDYYVSLQERVNLANNANATAFISIHINSYPIQGGKRGTETYYFTPQSEQLATTIHRHMVSTLQLPDNGIRRRGFFVLRNTTMPAVLVEVCYINHPSDGALLMDEQFRERVATAIFNGVNEYLSQF